MKLRFLTWKQDIKSRFDHEFHFRQIKLGMSMRSLLGYIINGSRTKKMRSSSEIDNCESLAYNLGEGDGTPLQYSCLENPMDRGAWEAAVHGVVKSRARLSNFTFTFHFHALLSNFTFTFHFHALEKEMATHSSVLAWRIPGMWEPGGLPSMGSHRVGHN